MEELLSDKIFNIKASVFDFLPETFIVITIFLLCLLCCFSKTRNSDLSPILTISIVIIIFIFGFINPILDGVHFGFLNTIQIDQKIIITRFMLGMIVLFSVIFFENTRYCTENNIPKSYFYTIITSIWLGASVLSLSSNFLTAFISLELISIPSYLLVGLSCTKSAIKAATKYVIFGMTATGLMIYGFSILYGLTGTFYFLDQEFGARLWLSNPLIIGLAMTLSLSGILFKICAAPLHFWVSGVYQYTSLSVIAFFSTIGTVASFIFLSKIVEGLNLSIQPIEIQNMVSTFVILLACITLILGAVGGIVQDNIKTILAYSAIVQSGFMLLLFSNIMSFNYNYLVAYLVIYILSTFLALYSSYFSGFDLDTKVSNAKGLFKLNPLLALSLLISLLSLAGLPPTAGFIGKFLIFTDLISFYQISQQSSILFGLITGVIVTVISLFFYFKVIYFSFFKDFDNILIIKTSGFQKSILILFVTVLIIIFFKIDWLLKLIN